MATDREINNKLKTGTLGSAGLANTANTSDALDQRIIDYYLPPDAFANTNSSSSIIHWTDRKLKVLQISISPFGANVTGNGSNYVTWTLDWNDGAGGASSTLAIANTNTTGLNTLTFGNVTTLASANMNTANFVINANSAIRLSSIKTGSGVALPQMLFSIRVQEV